MSTLSELRSIPVDAPISAGASPNEARSSVVNPLEHGDWDTLVAAHGDCSIFHSSHWARVLIDTYGYAPAYFLILQGNRLAGLFPVLEVRSALRSRRGVSLPFTDECQPVSRDGPQLQSLLQAAMGYGRSRGWKYLEWRGGAAPGLGGHPSLSFYAHTLDLSPGLARLRQGLEDSVARAIRKAATAGVVVETSQEPEAMRTFYALHCRTRRKHGLPPQPFSFFSNVQRHIMSKGLGFIATARHGQQPIAAAVFFTMERKAIYKFGASDDRRQALRGNNAVMWASIEACCRRGLETLDLGRTSLHGEGLRAFKRGWGCAERLLHYFKYDLRADRFVSERDRAVGWYNAFFRAAPPFLSRLAGVLAYRRFS